MTTYKVPYTFIPGTKSNASEVNANFSTVLDLIEVTNQNAADINLSNLTTAGKNAIYNNSAPSYQIGQIISSVVPLTDSGLHLIDGTLITGGGIYDSFVQYMANLSTTNPDLFCIEEEWQTSITNYGVCGKFVYDSENNTIRLPKITGIVEGTTDITALGDLIEAGLPSHTHTANVTIYGSGADLGDAGSNFITSPREGYGTLTLSGSATTINNEIYGKSETVQPQAIKVLYYIVIATGTKLDILSDIDNIVIDLNKKLNNDLTDITPQGKSAISNIGMPGNSSITLTLGPSGTSYTAPCDGWFYMIGTSSIPDSQNWLLNESSGVGMQILTASSGFNFRIFCPAKKGSQVTAAYTGTATCYLVFTPNTGTESEV